MDEVFLKENTLSGLDFSRFVGLFKVCWTFQGLLDFSRFVVGKLVVSDVVNDSQSFEWMQKIAIQKINNFLHSNFELHIHALEKVLRHLYNYWDVHGT